MSDRGYKIRNQAAMHFLTFRVVFWVDVFTRKEFKDVFIDTLKYCVENKDLVLYEYVIMPDHVHLLVSSNCGNLSGTVRDLKRTTSSKIRKLLDQSSHSKFVWLKNLFKLASERNKRVENFQLWEHQSHPMEIVDYRMQMAIEKYIHNNPVKAGWVNKPEEYLYSSARNHFNLEAVIDIESSKILKSKETNNK